MRNCKVLILPSSGFVRQTTRILLCVLLIGIGKRKGACLELRMISDYRNDGEDGEADGGHNWKT